MIIPARLHRDEWQPKRPWPDDCNVQWGDHGVVFGKNGARTTAFVETFPSCGGFFRGEGNELTAAEDDCWRKWQASIACTSHVWGRRRWAASNGGAICLKCKTFKSVFKPVVKLGEWRQPVEPMLLEALINGWMFPDPEEPDDGKVYVRRSFLKARAMGIALRPMPVTRERAIRVKWVAHARAEFRRWWADGGRVRMTDGEWGIQKLFGTLAMRTLERLADPSEDETDLDVV